MADFGISFKKARESRRLTLDQIAMETRINSRFLDAIEKEEFQVLPGGIFARGFVRAYAEQLGIDGDQAVAEFERLCTYQEPPLMEGLRVSTPQPERSRLSLYPIVIGVLVLLIVVFYFWSRTPSRSSAIHPPPAAFDLS